MKSQQSFGTFRGARELENAWATTSQPENLKKIDAKMLQTTEKWKKSRQKSFKNEQILNWFVVDWNVTNWQIIKHET